MSSEHQDFWFLLMADTQFGMIDAFSSADPGTRERNKLKGIHMPPPAGSGLAEESALYEKAIAAANRLKPDFAVICGDLVNDPAAPEQLDALLSITAKLDEGIPMRWVPGNHDCGVTPTGESLRTYRARFGDDYYRFDHKGTSFVVFNSTVWFDPSGAPDELENQTAFLRDALAGGRTEGAGHTIVLDHHPLFVKHSLEEDDWMVIPKARRRVLLDMFEEHGVSIMFSGHLHRNHVARYGDVQLVSTGPVGCPLGADPPGVRIVKVYEDRIVHEYFAMDELPASVEL